MVDRSKHENGKGEPGVHLIFQICTILFVKVMYQKDEFRRR